MALEPGGSAGPATGPGSWGTRGRGRPSRRRPARRAARAGCATEPPCRRGGRGATRCGTARARTGPGQRLADVVGGQAAVARRGHAPVLGDGPQPVDDPPDGHPRRQPQEQVQLGPPDQREGHEHQQLAGHDAQGDRAGRAAAQRPEQGLQVLPPAHAHRVPPQLAPERRPGDGVALVEVHVGLVRPELLAVVGEVRAAVGVERHERRIGEQPPPDQVVPPLVR